MPKSPALTDWSIVGDVDDALDEFVVQLSRPNLNPVLRSLSNGALHARFDAILEPIGIRRDRNNGEVVPVHVIGKLRSGVGQALRKCENVGVHPPAFQLRNKRFGVRKRFVLEQLLIVDHGGLEPFAAGYYGPSVNLQRRNQNGFPLMRTSVWPGLRDAESDFTACSACSTGHILTFPKWSVAGEERGSERGLRRKRSESPLSRTGKPRWPPAGTPAT